MTPVLAAVPVETLIWIALLLIGAIGSLASNARKAAATRGPAAQPVVPPRAQPVNVTLFPPPRPAPPIVVSRPRPVAAQTPPPASPPVPPPHPVPHGTSAFRGMFERGNLVRAVVAAEVLGPPKALQEQSIWSPRHSEPSI